MRLTTEQIKTAEFDLPGAYSVKGVAGSGKTSIGLQRASYLLKHKCPDPEDSVLILTYNRALLKYLDYQYEKIRESVPQQLRLDVSSGRHSGEQLQIDTIGEKMHQNYRKYHDENQVKSETLFFTVAERKKRKELFSRAIAQTSRRFPATSLMHEDHHNFLYGEVTWIKVCMYWNEQEYLQADRRLYDATAQYGLQLPKGSSTRRAIYALYRNFREVLKENGLHDFPDAEAMGYTQARTAPAETFTHIIVDESQDLSRLQLSFLRHILKDKPYATITFLYDISQSIYPTSWIGMKHTFSSVGFDVTGSRTRYLRRNYRASNEILSAARNMMSAEPHWSDNEPFYCNQSGLRPLHTLCSKREEQDQELVGLVRNLKEKFELEDIAITCRFNADLERIAAALDGDGISSEKIDRNTERYSTRSVKLLTFHSFKGLESEVVIIPELNNDKFPYLSDDGNRDEELFQERKLLYVAMTRATRMLFMFSYGETSSFVKDISHDLIRKVDLNKALLKESFSLESDELVHDALESYSVIGPDKEPPETQLNLLEESKKQVDELRTRLAEKDDNLKNESNTLSSLLEAMANNLNIQKDGGEDTTTLLEAIMEEMDKKSEENRRLAQQISKLFAEKEILRKPEVNITPLQIWISRLKGRYPKLNGQQIQSLAEAELLREMLKQTDIDCSTPYTVYTRVVESVMKKGMKRFEIEIPGETRPTFGVLFYEYMKDPLWFKILEPMDMAKVVEVRNMATHGTRKVSTNELTAFHRMLIEEKALDRMIELVIV